MPGVSFEFAAIIVLVLANGLFALAEIAIVSARKARLQQRAEEGSKGAAVALDLAADPDTFLSTVQIGITIVGTLAGAVGGAALASKLAVNFNQIPGVAPHGETVALAAVVVLISYLSLVIGELVPKRVALSNPERFASALAPVMHAISRATAPAVAFLTFSGNIVMRLLPFRDEQQPAVTGEEIKLMIREGTAAGTFEVVAQEMVEGVFGLGERRVVELMQPRHNIVWLDMNSTPEKIRQEVLAATYTRFPVGEGTLDNLRGFVHAKDLLNASLEGRDLSTKELIRSIPIVPEATRALRLLDIFKESAAHIAAVVNEHGGVEGIITLNDIMEAVVGTAGIDQQGNEAAGAHQREDGSWLIDGLMPIYEVKEVLGVRTLEGENAGGFTTLAGFILTLLRRIPAPGDYLTAAGYRFEVVDMDGHRIDKVLIRAETQDADAQPRPAPVAKLAHRPQGRETP